MFVDHHAWTILNIPSVPLHLSLSLYISNMSVRTLIKITQMTKQAFLIWLNVWMAQGFACGLFDRCAVESVLN